VKEAKTANARGTLLYSLRLLHANLDLSTLVDIILTDTPEARGEALVLLEDLLDSGLTQSEGALRSIARRHPFGYYNINSVTKDAQELLQDALSASLAP
jgi:hypothetical protein